MASNMENFDFSALDSAAFEETMSFLNNYDPTLLPDPLPEGFGASAEPSFDWSGVQDPCAWNLLGNAGFAGGVPHALTDSYLPECDLASHGLGSGTRPWELQPAVGSGASLCPDESGSGGQPSARKFHVGDLSNGKVSYFPEYELSDLDPLSGEMASPRLTCDWPLCTSGIMYASDLELSYHKTDVHIAEVLKSWPGSCLWPGCNSKIFFKTGKRLESHVYNIHITPLCCNEAGCKYKKPFERQADLERHIESKHRGERRYKCRYPQCQYTTGFSRKDKLKRHDKSYHNGQFPCQSKHCIYGFPSEDALKKHIDNRDFHRDSTSYECCIGSCSLALPSSFTFWNLRLHLEYDHKIAKETVRQAMISALHTRGLISSFTSTYLSEGLSGYQDCESCVEKLKEAASSKDVEQHQ